jgi:hypothetical protein
MSRKREGHADWELLHQTHKSIVAMSEKASTTDTNLQGMLGFFSSLRTLLEALRLQLHYLSLLARGSPWVWGSTSKCTCAHMALDEYGCSHGPDLQSLCLALTPPATSRPADHGSSSTCSLDSSTTMDSPDFSSASVTTVPDKVDITVALQMASLVDAYEAHSRCPLPQNPCLRPYTPNTALPRICINTSRLWGPLQDEQTLSALPTVVPAGRSCRCCTFGHVSQWPPPWTPLAGLPGRPGHLAPAKHC